MRRVLRAAGAMGAAAVLATACGDDPPAPPEVTFAVDGGQVVARPTQLCDVQVTDCTADPSAAVVLAVPPGTPLRIAVPEAIGDTPWLVVFAYRTGAGEQVSARSDLFASEERTEYTLTLPDAADQLETVEVQQLGGTFEPGTDGVEFPTRGTWVLSVDDR
ncbi:MAG TPA: DUF2771 family protein [Pseudonocardiaceae bacterium]